MNRIIGSVLAAALVVSPSMLAAPQSGGSAATVAGRWTMTVEGGPHGSMTMGLSLEQNGRKVAGTFASPHGDMPVEGEFVDGALTLSTVSRDRDAEPITFRATLKGETLSGYLSSAMGDMTWTAARAANR
jgi:hypothetical protein